MERAHHRTVDRVAALLEAVVRHPEGVGLSGLARRLGAPVSSVATLVDGLVATGFLDETDRRYTLGAAPSVLARRAGRPLLADVRHRDLADLATRVGAPVLLAVRLGAAAVYVDWAGAGEAFDFALSSRVRTPLPDTAAGRVLLAHLEPAHRRAIVRDARADPSDPEGADRAVVALLDELARVRAQGATRGPSGPLLPDAAAVAVGVRDDGPDGPVVAAVAVTVGSSASERRLRRVQEEVTAAARAWEARH